MTFECNKDDELDLPPPPRVIPRNCGQLLGRLDELLPFLYIARYGASQKDLRAQRTDVAPSLFAVAACTGGDRPGLAPRVGLVLPVGLCRDEKLRAALLDIASLVTDPGQARVSDQRRAVQDKLNAAFASDLVIADRETLDGFFALKPGPGLFHRLQAAFDYVTEVLDDTAGVVRVTGTSRFRWRTYGELMEWYHTHHESEGSCGWYPLIPFFVTGNTGALYEFVTKRYARVGLSTPMEEPSKWFVLRPDLPDAKLGVRLEMRSHGWARLHLTFDATTATISISNVYDPFEELIAWCREIDEGDLPIQMEIDEEGKEAVLTVLRTDDPARVLLRVSRKYPDEIMLEGILTRSTLAHTLQAELCRFFTTEFDPEHWDQGRADDPHTDYIGIKDRMLNHPWLVSIGYGTGQPHPTEH